MSTRARRRVLAMTGLVTAAGLPLTACALPFDLPGGDTSSGASAPDSSPATPSSSQWTQAGRMLTTDQALAALPQMPLVGSDEDVFTTDETNPLLADRSSKPPECVDILRLGETAASLEEHHVASARRSWSEPTGAYSVTIRSFDQPVGPDLLDRSGSAMATCSNFRLIGTDEDGTFEDSMRTSPRTVSPLGEQTFAARVTTFVSHEGHNLDFYSDQLTVRVGHNLVEAKATHQDEDTGMQRLEGFVVQMLTDLEKTP